MATKAEAFAVALKSARDDMTKLIEQARTQDHATAKRNEELGEALRSIQNRRPRVALDRTVIVESDFGHHRDEAIKILADVDDDGNLRIPRPDSVKAESVRTLLIPWMIDHFGMPAGLQRVPETPSAPAKRRRRATA